MDEPDEFFDREKLEIPTNVIPAEFNTDTTLSVVIRQTENQFDFALKSLGN